ncbi:MAG: hypothetical protein E7311_05425 [Clostridiales bacterium]|nr:hypothetical protein [Clostridiales bacterium]
MKNLRRNKTSGISLVALIVTIIVLIILTAAVIVTFMEGGIIEKAKEAVFKSDIRTYQEILAVKNAEKQIELATGNGEGGLYNADDLAGIQGIIPEFKEEYKDLIVISNGEIVLGTRTDDPYSKWLADLGIGAGETSDIALLEEGDYVVYSIPEAERKTYNITEKLGAEATNWIYNRKDTNRTYNEGVDEIIIGYNEEIKWRVLKNDGSTVTLVSADPVENIYLYGEEGFTKGPGALDAICKEVYGGRNLRVEDVNEVLKYEPVPRYYKSAGEEVNKELGFTFGDAMEETGLSISGSLPDDYEDLELYYSYNKSDCTEASEKAKDMIFRDKYYWLSSSCADVYFGSDASFRVRSVYGDYVDTYNLCISVGVENDGVCGLRPVVTLSSSIQVVDEEAGGDTQERAWEIK